MPSLVATRVWLDELRPTLIEAAEVDLSAKHRAELQALLADVSDLYLAWQGEDGPSEAAVWAVVQPAFGLTFAVRVTSTDSWRDVTARAMGLLPSLLPGTFRSVRTKRVGGVRMQVAQLFGKDKKQRGQLAIAVVGDVLVAAFGKDPAREIVRTARALETSRVEDVPMRRVEIHGRRLLEGLATSDEAVRDGMARLPMDGLDVVYERRAEDDLQVWRTSFDMRLLGAIATLSQILRDQTTIPLDFPLGALAALARVAETEPA